jgi:hypothetical protein
MRIRKIEKKKERKDVGKRNKMKTMLSSDDGVKQMKIK